ncbi:hypothetical protein K443DRAFT_626406 [Laccaria amethystina LaAM-08-1]|uniref:Uncharacterized protein n=1 Tax=Laccaria amethystina LaAM-08-1 TaxID=1095629 RepID=A0A0C9XMU5_9AGAR|nr:hypothetical protein K443DRAFT_626406 [Laccaria amethystina LaAM-08-1]
MRGCLEYCLRDHQRTFFRGKLVLDIVKVRMQLSKSRRAGVSETHFASTGAYIVWRGTPLALYKGLGAVLSGIVPKMAIRLPSFEAYKGTKRPGGQASG